MARLQIHLGPERVRRRDGDLRPVGAHLAPRHHPVQQVSEGQTFQDKRDIKLDSLPVHKRIIIKDY